MEQRFSTELGDVEAGTIQVYVSTQGSPRFSEYRAIVPNRFGMLDTEYK
jgi:hypothetical protein